MKNSRNTTSKKFILAAALFIVIILSIAAYIFFNIKNQPGNEESAPTIFENESLLVPVEVLLASNPLSLLGKDVYLTGILSVVTEKELCENCLDAPTLRGINFKNFVPLFGSVDPTDKNKLVMIKGKVIETPEGTLPRPDPLTMNIEPPVSLEIISYEPLSGINYHEFLLSNSTAYIENEFGCLFEHDKTLGWYIVDNVPYFIADWGTYPPKDPREYIMLYYNINGTLAKVEGNLKKEDVCS